MRISLIAVICPRGLISLLPECRGALCLLQRITREHRAAGVWAVMERGQASAIHELLAAGEDEWALDELTAAAQFRGPITQATQWPLREQAA